MNRRSSLSTSPTRLLSMCVCVCVPVFFDNNMAHITVCTGTSQLSHLYNNMRNPNKGKQLKEKRKKTSISDTQHVHKTHIRKATLLLRLLILRIAVHGMKRLRAPLTAHRRCCCLPCSASKTGSSSAAVPPPPWLACRKLALRSPSPALTVIIAAVVGLVAVSP